MSAFSSKHDAPVGVIEDSFNIPFSTFVLDNGLTVNVVENHHAPLVSFNIWYKVGAKDEPTGKTGFAHLFEHLMFAGSRHFPGSFLNNMTDIGATNLNGTTNHDRTNYYETVPVGALDFVLFAESDRMGHFFETINQQALDQQRGVVLNEKAEREGEPYGGITERLARACYPSGHPYAHTVLGEAVDLKNASLDDVRDWFRRYYTPNNAVISLVGDIDPGTAREKIERYFGDIPPGPPVVRPPVAVPRIPPGTREVYEERAPQGYLQLVWNLPAVGDKQTDQLRLAAELLAGGVSSRLSRRVIYTEQLASVVHAFLEPGLIASQFSIVALARPGQSLDCLERALVEELQLLMTQGAEEGELQRAKTGLYSAFINDNETDAAIAELLSSSHVLRGAPDAYKQFLQSLQATSVSALQTAMQQWLGEERYTLTVVPFTAKATGGAGIDRSTLPTISAPRPVAFPSVQHATLSNGLRIALIERHSHPLITLRLSVSLGNAQETAETLGITRLLRAMLSMGGAGDLDNFAFHDAVQSLGASIDVDGSQDQTFIDLNCLTSRLLPALTLFTDRILRPQFDPQEFELRREQMIDSISDDFASMDSAIGRVLPGLLYPAKHPYAKPGSGSGTKRSLGQLTLEQTMMLYQTWFRPDLAMLLVVGDTTLEVLLPELEHRLRAWEPGGERAPAVAAFEEPSTTRMYVIDIPGVDQSTIVAASVIPGAVWQHEAAFGVLSEILSHGFGSRINMNLRESKHWTYGVNGLISNSIGPRLNGIETQVQADKTGAAMEEILKEMSGLLTNNPVTEEELETAKTAQLLRLGSIGSSQAQLASRANYLLRHNLTDDYWRQYGEQIDRLTLEDLNQVAEWVVRPEHLTWIVAGDLSAIREQLERFGEPQLITGTGDELFDLVSN